MRDVIEMARRAGAVFPSDGSYHTFERREDLEAFAELVRADERKQAALDKKAENARELGLDYEPAPVQEPVAWGVFEGNLHDMFFSRTEADYMAYLKGAHAEVRPLYTTPPAAQRQWVGLTDEEIEKACVPLGAAMLSFTEVARVIEAKLKEKNT